MIRNYPKPPYKSAPEFMFGNPRNGEGKIGIGREKCFQWTLYFARPMRLPLHTRSEFGEAGVQGLTLWLWREKESKEQAKVSIDS
jgi:hypothetical protein